MDFANEISCNGSPVTHNDGQDFRSSFINETLILFSLPNLTFGNGWQRSIA